VSGGGIGGGPQERAAGAGRKPKLLFMDRLLVTLVHLRLGLPHAALAGLHGVDRSTLSAAVRQIRPLLASRGFAVPDRPGVRLRTLESVFAYAEAEGVGLRIDGTGVQVRRPKAGRPGRTAFVSGRKKQTTIKTTAFSDGQGRTVFSGVVRPGRMHGQTAVRTEGIAGRIRQHPQVKAKAGEGCRGLANEFPDQVDAPPGKPKDDAPIGEQPAWCEQRRRQCSARICVEHTNAEYKQWRPLQRFTGRREAYPETHPAIAGLVSDRSDRSARRVTRRRPGTELVLARPPPADHPSADPPGQQALNSVAPKVVRPAQRRRRCHLRCPPMRRISRAGACLRVDPRAAPFGTGGSPEAA
jgi:hypothetical protein